ncbi:MAG TPA: metallophosphoesterase [Sandaracinaceae bacterium LLY-WYZ-13_1]|nr:metallophosphoesterase [Sandaracinaceae bacterium LLY-WYZ-13_1]
MSVTRMVVFLVVVLALTGGLHYYLWLRMVRDPAWPAPWSTVGTWALVLLGLSIPVGFVASRFLSREASAPFAWVAFGWMGLMFLALVLLLPSELVRLTAGWLGRGTDELTSEERRRFLSRGIAGVVGAASAGLGALSLSTALRPVDIARVTVKLRALPEALRDFRIVQLTDIHVGPTIGRDFIEELVDKTNAQRPDLIAITGDLVDGSVEELAAQVEPLKDLRARHGVFFVTGNHEYYSGADDWIAHLGTLGIRVLGNERVTLHHDGAALDVVGVHDWESDGFGHGADLAKALAGKPADRKALLLAHQPKQIDEASRLGVDLQISGHTHGGQIFPFNYLVRLQQPYVAGLHTHGDSQLYVSRGTGYWGPPMRLGIPAEITRIVLRPA